MDKCDNCGREYDETLYSMCPKCNDEDERLTKEERKLLDKIMKENEELYKRLANYDKI